MISDSEFMFKVLDFISCHMNFFFFLIFQIFLFFIFYFFFVCYEGTYVVFKFDSSDTCMMNVQYHSHLKN